MTKRRSRASIGPVEFIDKVLKLDEKGEPFSLSLYQRRVLEMALRRDPAGELLFRVVLLSEPKKSGKTFLAACLTIWWRSPILAPRSLSAPTMRSRPLAGFQDGCGANRAEPGAIG